MFALTPAGGRGGAAASPIAPWLVRQCHMHRALGIHFKEQSNHEFDKGLRL